jgi:hypothetical protein
MIKVGILIIVRIFLISCNTNLVDNQSVKKEIQDAVKNSTIIAKNLRHNPENLGGDETSLFEPSTYFNSDPLYVADQRPIWMRKPDIAHIFLIALIASDHGFDENSWSVFFRGFEQSKRPSIIYSARNVNESEYAKICKDYSYANYLTYADYIKKISILNQ